MARRIFHIALQREWDAAAAGRYYDRSSLGLSLAEVGFVHCSRAEQWQRVRDLVFADVTEPLVLLTIDTARLDAPVVDEPVVDEPGASGSGETFPHLYGALPVSAVVGVTPIAAPGPAGPATVTAGTDRSFRSLLVAEVAIRLVLAVAVMALTVLVASTLDAVREPPAGILGALVTFVVATAAAVALYRRRERRTTSRRG